MIHSVPAEPIRSERDARGVATVTLDRPGVHNALDGATVSALRDALQALHTDPAARLIILRGAGKNFCAGADLASMRRIAKLSEEENFADAMLLAELLTALDRFPKPTIAAVHGAAFGGGVGLVACCDIAFASSAAVFCLSEVRLGLIPGVISPYVINAIGARAARRYFQSGERFDAAEAQRIGLVHGVCEASDLDPAVERCVDALLEGAPGAQSEAKRLIEAVGEVPRDEALRRDTARRVARTRISAEGREGVTAFLEKRPPRWRPGE